jgi:hypothetical protein
MQSLPIAGRRVLATVMVVVAGRLLWYVWSSVTTWPSGARIAVWAVGFGVTLLGTGLLFYRRLWRGDPLAGTGVFAPRGIGVATETALATLGIWFFLTAPFAFGTYLSERERLLAQLAPGEQTADAFDKAASEYAWQAVDVLPFIKATETLNWTEPARHWRDATDADAGAGYSTQTGVLLVLYKILVLAPVLAAGRIAWIAARRRDATSASDHRY